MTDTYNTLYQQVHSILLYQEVLNNPPSEAFLKLLESLITPESNLICLKNYTNWFKTLAATGQSWQDYVIKQILLDDNPFTQQVQRTPLQDLPEPLIVAAQHDLNLLQNIASLSIEKIASQVNLVPWELPTKEKTWLHQVDKWGNALPELAKYYVENGTGIFGQYQALSWQQGQFLGIAYPDSITLDDIIGYQWQKETLIKNTEFLLAGYKALNVLLYGSRGSGKSSLVKALLSQYAKQGLRLIEIPKSELRNLPLVLQKLRSVPQKFIIFVDDLSFEEDLEGFKAMKVVLEGSVTTKSPNVVIYATSNRRHLIKEFFSDRPRPSEAEEIHAWDSVQEKLSFSDRFGITLTFEPANQNTYLEIVRQLASKENLNISTSELEFRAKQWATQHNGRSGRTARQFIDFLGGELTLPPPQCGGGFLVQ